MSAPSLYRRHRPRTFEDVVGQDHVVRTLRNAIEQGKVHHAYLFVGSRGTGKTSMAKILASCLDCERGGPTVHPCGECESCLSIQRATSLDVVEMDAASNNSVDDVRELRERVQTTATGGRWRVYILDEAHMLTTQAWNALLKTLEEPPPQTVFVLATTEAHKVPATVVDRCHRFDFTRPTGAQISRVLGRVAERESLQLTPGAQALVSRHANGSFRDALGTLEQLVTYAGNSVTEQDAVTVLGIGDEAQVFGAVDRVIEGDAAGVLRAVQDVASHGRDLGSFMRELERHGRDLLVCCILGGVPPEIRLTDDRDRLLDDQARRIGRDQATRLLELLASALTAARDGADARAMLELALVKAADPTIDPALRALQARLARLEERLAGGAPAAAPSPPPAAPAPPQAAAQPQATPQPPRPAQAPPAALSADRPVPASAPAVNQPPAHPAPASPPAPQHQPQTPQAMPSPPQHVAPAPPQQPGAHGGIPHPGADIVHAGQPVPPLQAVPDLPAEPQRPQLVAEPAVRHAEPVSHPSAPAGPPPAIVPAAGPAIEEIVAVWGGVIENLRGRDTLGAVALEHARPVELNGEELTIAFPTDAAFYRGTADREERRLALREALKEVTGATLAVRFELRDLTTQQPEQGGAPGAPPSPGMPPVRQPVALDEQAIVAHLVTEFDAEELADGDQEPS